MTQTPQAPAPPPALRPGQQVSVKIGDAPAIPVVTSVRDIAALETRRRLLSEQLSSASGRRADVRRQLQSAVSTVDRTGLEQRLAELDARIVRLEHDIDVNSQALASVDATRLSAARSLLSDGPRRSNREKVADAFLPLSIVFTLFVLSPLAFSISRVYWRRGGSQAHLTALPAETSQRLERMEQAMDSIAIEVERVSEGQRFVTRLLAEGRTDALGAIRPAMEPVRVGLKDPATSGP